MPMLNKNNFKCQRCGECCKAYTVVLHEQDIKKIKQLGYSKDFFAIKDYNPEYSTTQYVLKRENSKCLFLRFKDNQAYCEIYKNRPRICRIYPFFKEEISSCKPQNLVKNHNFYKSF